MNTFQLIIVILVFIYVVGSLYFSITGRILAHRRENKDDEKWEKSNNYEEQIKVLTTRFGELTTLNFNLDKSLKEWQAAYCDMKKQYEEANENAEKYKDDAKKAESKYLKVKKELDKLQTAAGTE